MVSIERYFWIFFIAISTGVILHIRRKLGLRDRRGMAFALLIGNLPWIVEGVALITNPKLTIRNIVGADAGWARFAMIGSVVTIWVTLYWWLFRFGGAEQLEANPVRILNLPQTASGIKLFFILALGGGVIGLVAMIVAGN